MALSKEKAEIIASNYCTVCNFNKSEALIESGYSRTYAKSGRGLKIYEDILVKQAISKIQASNQVKTAYNATKAEQELEQARLRAIELKQVSAEIGAITGKCKLYALMTDKLLTDTEQKQELDQAQEQEAREIAKLRLVRGA